MFKACDLQRFMVHLSLVHSLNTLYTIKGPSIIFTVFTSVQRVLFLHIPSLLPKKAYYKNVDWLNLFHVQVQ